VLRRIGHAFTVFALLIAIGAHWTILQSIAWTTMLADNLRDASLSEAVGRTFNGEHPCALCKEIAKSKQAEKKTEFLPKLKKHDFSFKATLFIFTPPAHFYEVRLPVAALETLSEAPPVPPPINFLG
jgi:hypothetical protein